MKRKVVNLLVKDNNETLGSLMIPNNSTGIIIFAHGSGSTGNSYRNQILAEVLNKNGFSTLLFDLLTEGEKQIDSKAENLIGKIPGIVLNKFNVDLLASRLATVTDWVQNDNDTKDLKIGYFGASTGVAAALYVTANLPEIKVLVSRSGRSDLVDKKSLASIRCPCMFIAGGIDKKVISINKNTMRQLKNSKNKKMEIIDGASHLFEEQGKITQVADISLRWFKTYLGNYN